MDALAEALRREHPNLENGAPVTMSLPRYDGWAGVPYLSARPVVQWSADPAVTMALITCAVCEFYGVRKLDVLSRRNTKDVCRARHVAMYLCREFTLFSFPSIGRYLGNRDHTTILDAVRKIERLMLTDERLADEIEILKLKLGGCQ